MLAQLSADTVLRLAAALGCGLMAGVFFGFSTFIMKALGRLPPAEGIAAMQGINVYALRSFFLPVFLGTVLLCAWTVAHGMLTGGVDRWCVAGAACYVMGGFLLTVVGNVPMNHRLAALPASSAEAATYWAHYLMRWTQWNHVRTLACLLALGCYVLSLRKG